MDALLVIDMQKDFIEGGALPVPGANRLVPFINLAIARFRNQQKPILFSRCWHPVNHISFLRWPPHCIQGSKGAEFVDDLMIPEDAPIISKGVEVNQEGYSAFEKTNLLPLLQEKKVRRLFLAGVAMEYCVYRTAKDALENNFEVVVVGDCVAGLHSADMQKVKEDLRKQGAAFMESGAIPC